MKIKEVEEQLGVSRSNIRFYEKEGLLSPDRKENNYRDYSEQDVAALKKILVLRKLGFTVEEIFSMQKGELALADAARGNIRRLEQEISSLQGALEITKSLSTVQSSFETLDQEGLWNEITQSEQSGRQFVDICKDWILFERDLFDGMWRRIFLYNFQKSRQRHGALIACGLLLLICLGRGIIGATVWQESFWKGFLYPFILFFIGSILFLPIYILSKKAPKAAAVVCTVILILGLAFLALCVLAILYGILSAVFS